MKNKRNPMYLAVQSVLATGALLSAGTVFAQEDEDKVELDRVVTTGTHIRATDLETAAPVFSIDREDIQRTGLTDVGDLLRQIPAAGASLNLTNNNGGDGSINVDLRNLGATRTLVLVNGRRWVKTIFGTADLTNIPISVIERIDVLKDGASAIYGSDAIGGVINIITRSDYEGAEAGAYYGVTGEDDGARQKFSVSMGTSSDRGSVFFNAEYTKIESISAADRTLSQLPQYGTGVAGGSAGTPQGRFVIATPPGGSNIPGECGSVFGNGISNCTTTPGSNGWDNPNDPDIIPFTNDTRFNYAPDNFLITPQERTSVFVQGKYQLTDNISVSTEALFNRRESSQLLAPQPLFFGFFTGSRPGVQIIDIGGDNPFNPYGVDIPGTYIGLIGRRMVEAGNRIFSQKVDTFHYGLGFEGFIDAGTGWDWNVNYSLGRNDLDIQNEGELNMLRVNQALSNDCVTASGQAAGCVPLNLFGGEGSITQAMVDYISFEGHRVGQTKQISYDAVVSTELLELPAGPLGFAAGYEHRRESGYNKPDYVVVSGATSGNQQNPTSGATTVDEFFVEFNVPLLADVPGAEILEFSVAARYSDYDAFGSDTTGKLGIRWKPFEDLLVRATYAEGFRAPNINELFGGGGDSFPGLGDPCSGNSEDDENGDGVQNDPETQPGCVGIPSNYVQPNSQIRITVGSNENLQPETSESFTVGLVYEPGFVDGLVMSLDYYDIEIDNVITSLSAQTILNVCAQTGTTLCELVTRIPAGNIIDVLSNGRNQSARTVSGVDFNASYSFDTDYGLFKVIWDTSYTKDFFIINESPIDGTLTEIDLLDVDNSGFELPEIKSNMTFDWAYGDWHVNYQMRYIAGHDESCGVANTQLRPETDPNAPGGIVPADFLLCNLVGSGDAADTDTYDQNHIGGTTIHDASVAYHLADYDMSFSLGIENLFDKTPPISTQAFANSYEAGLYDGAGRYYWFSVNKRF